MQRGLGHAAPHHDVHTVAGLVRPQDVGDTFRRADFLTRQLGDFVVTIEAGGVGRRAGCGRGIEPSPGAAGDQLVRPDPGPSRPFLAQREAGRAGTRVVEDQLEDIEESAEDVAEAMRGARGRG